MEGRGLCFALGSGIDGKESAVTGDPGLVPGWGRSTWRKDRLPSSDVSYMWLFLRESACNLWGLGSVLDDPRRGSYPPPLFWPEEFHETFIVLV